jgi:large subunit ribosomal protein L35
MAHKAFKPNKSMLSRFKVSKTGKLKRHHAKTSHLLSGRSGQKKRHLGRPAIVFEGIARNLRRAMGVGHKNPIRTAHNRALAAKKPAEAQAAATA